MIITRLIGGLGNQMFQYAMGRSLAIKNGTQLKLDISAFQNYSLHNGYELDTFNISAHLATSKEIDRLKYGRFYPFAKLIENIFGKDIISKKKYYKEISFDHNPQVLNFSDNIYLEGYWQSEKYFKNIAKILRDEFTFVNPLEGKNLVLADKINKCNSVSIHIRRGDYLSNPETNKVHGVCGLDYYWKGIEYIRERVDNPSFFVFSDDIEWAKSNLRNLLNVEYVDHNCGKNSFEDMRLMSFCKHHIIANSSFSWWGAWLNVTENKIVIAPEKWFVADVHDTKDLIPEGWIKI